MQFYAQGGGNVGMHMSAPPDMGGNAGWVPLNMVYGERNTGKGRGLAQRMMTPDPCQAVCFDEAMDLLWVGWESGRISSYLLPQLQVYTAVKEDRGPVLDIAAPSWGVISLSANSWRVHTKGCLSRYGAAFPQTGPAAIVSNKGESASFSCFSTPTTASQYGSSLIHIGTSAGTLMTYDMMQMHAKSEPWSRQVSEKKVGMTVMEAGNRGLVCCGFEDGKIALVDMRMNATSGVSTLVRREFSAHHGAVTSLSASGDFLVTCGDSQRPGFSDSMAKVFDLRAMRETMPIQFTYQSAPCQASFLRSGSMSLNGEEVVAAVSRFGMITLQNTVAENPAAMEAQFQAELNGARVKCFAAAMGGRVLAFGDSSGGCQLWSCGSYAPVGMVPPAIPILKPPKRSIHPAMLEEDPACSAVSIAVPPVLEGDPKGFLSTYPETLERAWAGTRQRRHINPQLLEHVVQHEGDPVGFIDLSALKKSTGINLNASGGTLLFGEDKSKAFTVADPRKKQGFQHAASGGPSSSMAAGAKEIDRPPKSMRRVNVFEVTKGFDSRLSEEYNKTEYIGLENRQPNCYVNALLQVLYAIVPLKNMLYSHLSGIEVSIADELGFLFHMMDCCRADGRGSEKSVEPRNLLRYYSHIPEAVALGLLEPSSKIALSRRAGLCMRFFLDRIQKEILRTEKRAQDGHASNAKDRAASGGASSNRRVGKNPKPLIDKAGTDGTRYITQAHALPAGHVGIEGLFGTRYKNVDGFKSGAKSERMSTSLIVDMEGISGDFCADVRSSFMRKVRVQRAWCEESKQYEPLVKSRYPTSLPTILCVNIAAETVEESLKAPMTMSIYTNGKGELKVSEVDEVPVDAEEGTKVYELFGVVSCIVDPFSSSSSSSSSSSTSSSTAGHLISHVLADNGKWHLFNDFAVSVVEDLSVISDFTSSWRQPCMFLFREQGVSKKWASLPEPERFYLDSSIFQTPSLSMQSGSGMRRTFLPLDPGELPAKDSIIAIDCEFVATSGEESEITASGRRVVTKASKLSLARVSITRETGVPFVDDYIVKSEPVVDYLTRFSGLHPGDLDPSVSTKHLVSLKTAYLKLRLLVDSGVKFCGHGLRKDFRMINIFVPQEQILDTVLLYRLPGQRAVGLRFLMHCILSENVQEGTHDAVEDALAALKLYKKYLEFQDSGSTSSVLEDLYRRGHESNWRVR
eukprot:g3057.t1